MISIVLVTFNEAEKLQNCLENLIGFSDEVVIIDLGSTDESEKLGIKYGAKIYKHDFVDFVEEVRNYAISKAKGDWILVLDPDEIITDSLKDKLKEIISSDYSAVNIPRKNIFFGKWIAHTNWWPDRHIRFFKKGKVTWSKKIHSYPKVNGTIINLEAKEGLAIVHFGYQSIEEFMDRQNRYSSIEAQNLFDSGVKFSWPLFFWKPVREFLVRFIRHRGFLDGFYGFALTVLMMIYQLQVMIELWEKEQTK